MMPTAKEILSGLTTIANEFIALSIVWHLILLLVLIFILKTTWRPQKKWVSVLLVLPLLGVSLLAWIHGNPFNGTMLLIMSLLLGAVGRRLTGVVSRGPKWAVRIGIGSLAFAWCYPHFMDFASPWLYLITSPMGLIPCPTLAVLLGFGLLTEGLGSRLWTLMAVSAGVF